MPTIAITAIAVLAYLLATLSLYLRLVNSSTASAIAQSRYRGLLSHRFALTTLLLALLLHATALWQQIEPLTTLNLTLFYALSLAAWSINLLALIPPVCSRTDTPGLITYPIAMLSLLLAATLSVEESHLASLAAGVKLHIFLSILSYSLLSLAALQALLLAFQDSLLRRRRFLRAISLFPPLERMESSLFRTIGLGYILLTASLLSGATYLEDMVQQHLIHKTVLSIVAWLIFATLLWGRLSRGWRGATAIRWTLAGFIALLLAYFGSKFVLELLLNRP
ncbi:cytochrome C biogenesis protein [Ectothiorhodospiraceae bacterium BW-2]|nr:cytochrome C biogenesis protein [Ectothiorhodospiraceae bacterium BW-2]